jgi:hypothetical protein
MQHSPAIRLLLCLLLTGTALADGERDNNPVTVRRVPKEGIEVPAGKEASLRTQLSVLQQKIAELQKSKDPKTRHLLADVMIFERAIRCALDYDEFFSPKDIDSAVQLAVEGIDRANQLLEGNPKWPEQSGLVVRGYISRIDNTVQPYGLVVPETYAFNRSVPTRCDLWFHGRGETLSEVNFIHGRMKSVGQYAPDHTIVLHPYGRYSNAFKFAGETDVLEALEDVKRRYRIDDDRISVRGFSMGGAACWQFAVHYADQWFAANPGAGFSETPQFLKFFQKETLNPKPWEHKLWNLYDCDKYATNLIQCPTIAYSGEVDIQKQAADVMEQALQQRGLRLRHIIGAGMGHKIDEASQVIIESGMTSLAANAGAPLPRKIQLETCTLKYNKMHWLKIDSLREHWKHAQVDTEMDSTGAINISCTNVKKMAIAFEPGQLPLSLPEAEKIQVHIVSRDIKSSARSATLIVPGPFSDGSLNVELAFNDVSGWGLSEAVDSLAKKHNLQGPIDDAFMDSFIFVRPTGKAANELVGKWADAELERAIEHWRRHFRGDARVVNDTDITDKMIATANLILWGDPSSNSVMGNVASHFPVKWTNKQIVVGNKTFNAADHAPILIYPNPLNPNRYVVLNSSFTFRDYAYLNNARQVPMLPDWAVVDLKTPPGNVWPGEVVAADFFDEEWKLK